jgi:uncharacterized tellurite resistance protein B-like protein
MGEISEEVLMATFSGMGRTNDELVYFDKQNKDVLSYVSGYFSSLLGDQSQSNRTLANRITSGSPNDYIDKSRHILIDRLLLSDFLDEYHKQSQNKEPFSSFSELFGTEVLKDFSYDNDITINDLTFSNHIQQKFHKVFSENYQSRVHELRDDYTAIFENTCNELASKWIREKVFNNPQSTKTMEFNLAEKLAIVKAVDEIILADGRIDKGEIAYLGQLMQVLDFDFDFVEQARKFNNRQAISVLQQMSEQKKQSLAIMLHEMANADGEIDDSEMNVLAAVFLAAGINLGGENEETTEFDVSDIYFESSDHLRYENGEHKSGPHGGAKRAIKVEPNIEGKSGYSVTTYNLDGVHPVWGNNVQMAPKQMKIISSDQHKTTLRGYGADPRAMGDQAGEYSNYGISIFHPNNEIEKIILHMHDRNVDIEYLQ